MKDILSPIKGQGPDVVIKDEGHPANQKCKICYRIMRELPFQEQACFNALIK
jgi:hypothetical protein